MRANDSSASLDYPILFTSPHATRTRWLARIYLSLAGATTVGMAVMIAVQVPAGLDSAPTKWALCGFTLAIAWTAACSMIHRARNTIVRLQLWPRSNLAVIHTPGVVSAGVSLIPISEFGDPSRPGIHSPNPFVQARSESGEIRIRLNSGRHLYFDPVNGTFPAGRQTLAAFLHRREVPLIPDTAANPTSARGRDGREPAGPKFPVDRVAGALEAAHREAARFDILESGGERRQQQRRGKPNA